MNVSSDGMFKSPVLSFIHSFVRSFIREWIYSPLLDPGLFFSFVIFFTQTVGLLGRVISPSQGRYLHTGQHKHRINAHIDIHALSEIRTHSLSIRASEGSSSLTPCGDCDRRSTILTIQNKHYILLVLLVFSIEQRMSSE
jgi:hypothetical protein